MSLGSVVKSGFMLMERGKKWERLFCVLLAPSPSSPTPCASISIFKSPTDSRPLEVLQVLKVKLLEEMIMVLDGSSPSRQFYLCCDDLRHAEEWVLAMRAAQKEVRQPSLPSTASGEGDTPLPVPSTNMRSSQSDDGLPGMVKLEGASSRWSSRSPPPSSDYRTESFIEFFITSTPLQLHGFSLANQLGVNKVRSIAWKYYLGILPTSDYRKWADSITRQREDYIALRGEAVRDTPSLAVNLSSAGDTEREGGGWDALEEKNNEGDEYESMLTDINKDIMRTQGGEMFAEVQYQIMARAILIATAHRDKLLGYKQGMLELLVVIIGVLREEASKVALLAFSSLNDPSPSSSSSATTITMEEKRKIQLIVQSLTDANYIEADAYLLLNKIMQRMYYLYSPTPNRNLGASSAASGKGSASVSIMVMFERVQNDIVRRMDEGLWQHLTDLHIEPHMYLIRWTRLLFAREYRRNQLCYLWDGIFSMNHYALAADISIIEFIAAAMVVYIKDDIMMEEETSGALNTLVKYPPMVLEDITNILHMAAQMQSKPNRPLSIARPKRVVPS